MSRSLAPWLVLAPAIVLASAAASAPPERVVLTMQTLHAAALTTPRATGDSTDAPFFVVEVAGPQASSTSILPDAGLVTLRQNEQVGTRPLTELTLGSGDTIQVMVSVLENAKAKSTDVASVAPLMKEGARLIGSVSLMVTNEGGTIYWRRLNCVEACKVLSRPASAALAANKGQPAAGVAELSGSGGTYHLALQANRAE